MSEIYYNISNILYKTLMPYTDYLNELCGGGKDADAVFWL